MKDKRLSARARAHRSKHACVALLSALLAVTSHNVAATSAAAADKAYPVKPVRVVVPYAPGGGTDVLARLVAAKLSEAWGQSVIVDNRPGGATVIGAETVARAPADGYTLLIGTPTHVVNATLLPKLPFDPVRDFEPITLLSTSPNIFVVHPSLPVRTTKQFLALAKAKPGQITYGSSGNGGTGHLSMEMIKQMSGIKAIHVPYKGGGPAINAVLSGEVSALINNMVPTVQHVKAGRLRALAVTSKTRSKVVPDVPVPERHRHPTYDPVPEDIALSPQKLYAKLKRTNEDLAGHYASVYGLDVVALRFGSAFAPGKAGRFAITNPVMSMIEAAAGTPYQVETGGDQCDDLCYSGESANGFLAVLGSAPRHGHFRVYNISHGELVSLRQMAETLQDMIPGWHVEIGPGLDYRNYGLGAYFRMSLKKASEEIGYRPKFDFRLAAADYIETQRRLNKSRR